MTDTTNHPPHPAIAGLANAGHPAVDVLRFITGGYYIDAGHVIRGPRAIYSPVMPEATSQPIIHPRSIILHTNAGPHRTAWASLFRYWSRTDITGEAHFQVSGVTDNRDGSARLVQTMPLNRRADCNARANSWLSGTYRVGAVSFETEDDGAASLDRTPWSLGQLDLIVAASTAIAICYGVWCTVPARWDDSGIGHHALHPEWSIYRGKTCPGAARIRQMDHIRARVASNLAAYGEHTGWKCGKGAR
jgi:hypothetical protein